MRLAHALRLITESEQRPGSALRVYLVTGFESLHLKTFLHAHLTEQAVDRPVEVLSGLFDDFEGNLRRAAACSQTVVVILIEWADLDPRLGFRHATKWSSEVTDDIVNNVTGTLKRIEQAIVTGIGRDEPTVVMSPSLPLAPPFDTNNQQLVAVAQELYTGVDQLLSQADRHRRHQSDSWRSWHHNARQFSAGPADDVRDWLSLSNDLRTRARAQPGPGNLPSRSTERLDYRPG